MAIKPNQAALITVKELPTVVQKAVEAAGIRVGTSDTLAINWELAGIVVKDWGEGDKASEAISRQIVAAGYDAVPAVLSIDKRIIAGFFERPVLPQVRNF